MSRHASFVASAIAVTFAGAALSLSACGEERSSLRTYQPARSVEAPWCADTPGRFKMEWWPTVAPSLVGCPRTATAPPDLAPAPVDSTLAELTVLPGAAIELPVTLPPSLRGARCRLDSVVLAHGEAPADLAIALRAGEVETPIVAYASMPPPPRPPEPAQLGVDVPPRVLLHDPQLVTPSTPRSSTSEASSDPLTASSSLKVSAELGPTGVVLTLQVVSEEAVVVPVAPPRPVTLVRGRHAMDVDAPDTFSIVLRARAQPFTIGVRSSSEFDDPRLRYLAPGATAAVPTSLIPQAAVVVSHCQRPAKGVFASIE
ncbi:MAG: hypothetical protein R3B48_15515 [Kofleriaceae bacterium]